MSLPLEVSEHKLDDPSSNNAIFTSSINSTLVPLVYSGESEPNWNAINEFVVNYHTQPGMKSKMKKISKSAKKNTHKRKVSRAVQRSDVWAPLFTTIVLYLNNFWGAIIGLDTCIILQESKQQDDKCRPYFDIIFCSKRTFMDNFPNREINVDGCDFQLADVWFTIHSEDNITTYFMIHLNLCQKRTRKVTIYGKVWLSQKKWHHLILICMVVRRNVMNH
jgi:hypothetical protein